MSEVEMEDRYNNIRNWLLWCYTIFFDFLIISSILFLLSGIHSYDDANIFGFLFTIFFICSIFAYPIHNIFKNLFEKLYDLEQSIRLLFIEVFITAIFLFSLIESPKYFSKIGFWWGIISPLAAILSSAVFMVPFIKNRKIITAIGIVTATFGFVSSFLKFPILEIFNIILTMLGALLTVVGIGSPEIKK